MTHSAKNRVDAWIDRTLPLKFSIEQNREWYDNVVSMSSIGHYALIQLQICNTSQTAPLRLAMLLIIALGLVYLPFNLWQRLLVRQTVISKQQAENKERNTETDTGNDEKSLYMSISVDYAVSGRCTHWIIRNG